MGKILTVDEMLEALTILEHPQRNAMVAKVEAIASDLANMVAATVECERGEAVFEPGFGGTCVSFTPREHGGARKWPEDLEHLDSGGDFDPAFWGTSADV